MKSNGVFITGTGTGVGKTLVSCLIASLLSGSRRIGVMKPFASGTQRDAKWLRQFSGRNDLALSEVNPIFYKKPLAPFSASDFGKKAFSAIKLNVAFQKIRNNSDFIIMEGIGGLAVPITRETAVADWVLRFQLPVIVIAHPWLGTLNHTLLTLEYARCKALNVIGVVLNYSQRRKDVTEATNVRALRALEVPLRGILPFVSGTITEKVNQLKTTFSAKDFCLWIQSL